MLDVRVDRSDSTDLHEQVAAEIRRAIAELLEFARRHGYRRDDLVRLIERIG